MKNSSEAFTCPNCGRRHYWKAGIGDPDTTKCLVCQANALTEAQTDALVWLSLHNGEGTFTGRGAEFLAGGEIAPHAHSSWNGLVSANFIRKNDKRLELTPKGRETVALIEGSW